MEFQITLNPETGEIDEEDLKKKLNFAKKQEVENPSGYPLLQCPYCLYSSMEMTDFIIVGRPKRLDGYSLTLDSGKPVLESGSISKKMAHCPKCKVTLRRQTLVQTGKMSVQQYARWVAASVTYDVDHRVKFGRGGPIRAFLEAHDIENEFWTAYKEEKQRIDPTWIPWDQRKKETEINQS
jgi:hypothetical protein